MSTSRTPRGPLPAKVYWRRRIVVGLGLLAVLVAIALIVVRPGQGAATPPSDPPASSPAAGTAEATEPDEPEPMTPEPTTEASAGSVGDPAACTPASVRVEAVMDRDDYTRDQLPQLSLKVTNTGGTPCLLEAGTDVQEYRITSGSDLIWSSKHCQQEPQAARTVLDGGESVSTTPFKWSRERSDPNTCAGDRASAVGGGATYVLEVFVGTLQSESNRFVLL